MEWKGVVGWLVPRAVAAVLWMGAAVVALVGAVMLHEWRELAERGAEAVAHVKECEFHGSGFKRGGSGYYVCTFAFQPEAGGPLVYGSFQTSRGRGAGEPVPIRYLPERPNSSATAEDLRHPSLVPGSILAMGLGFLGYLARRAWKDRSTSPAPARSPRPTRG